MTEREPKILERLQTARKPFATSKVQAEAAVYNACLEAEEEIKSLLAMIEDACEVFIHYDLPEHAFHYRRLLKRAAST